VVLDEKVRAIGPRGLDGPAEKALFLGPELAGHGVELEGDEVVVPAKRDKHIEAGLFLFGRVAESVGPHPDAHSTAETGRRLDQGGETAGELGFEFLGFQRPVMIRDEASDPRRVGSVIDVAHIERIDVEGQAVLVMEPQEEGHVDESLGLGRPFVLTVDPVEVVRPGRRELSRRARDRRRGLILVPTRARSREEQGQKDGGRSGARVQVGGPCAVARRIEQAPPAVKAVSAPVSAPGPGQINTLLD
jgi:hypothetical protein